jgi:hypothetical protein
MKMENYNYSSCIPAQILDATIKENNLDEKKFAYRLNETLNNLEEIVLKEIANKFHNSNQLEYANYFSEKVKLYSEKEVKELNIKNEKLNSMLKFYLTLCGAYLIAVKKRNETSKEYIDFVNSSKKYIEHKEIQLRKEKNFWKGISKYLTPSSFS